MNELLAELERRKICLWREGGQLRFSAPAGALTPELRAELAARKAELLAHLSERGEASGAIPRADRRAGIPLSFAQETLWVLDQLEPVLAAYNVSHCWRITGPLDAKVLERSLDEIVRRHEILRTTFEAGEGRDPRQFIHPHTPIALPVLPAAPEDLGRRALAEAGGPFDLAAGPLWRATLLRFGADDHALLCTWHHIVCDAWSDALFSRELSALYSAFSRGEASPLPELPIQYGDFADWQRSMVENGGMQDHLAYWRKRLEGRASPLTLPADRPRPARQSYRGAACSRELARALSTALPQLAREEGVTLFVLVLAAFKALLARYSGETDLCIGSPIAQRPRVETEGLVGFFLTMLALRTDLSGDPAFRDLLRRVRETTLGGFAHQEVPFERIVEELHPTRHLSHHPLFQVAFVLTPEGAAAPVIPSLAFDEITPPTNTAKFDLTLFVQEKAGGAMEAVIEYATDQFDAPTIERMLASFERLLTGIVADPATPLSRLPLLSAEERGQLVMEWNRTERPYPADRSLPQLFADWAYRTPEAVAVLDGAERITYAELDARSNEVARSLRAQGLRAGGLVGLDAERSTAFVVGVLGILKAGGAYVPLDALEPAERLAAMQAACALILEKMPPAAGAEQTVAEEMPADSPAYVLFTSGSTGVPKGVIVPHRAISRLVMNNDFAPFAANDVVAFASNVCFDAATLEIWGALLNGGTLVVTPREVLLSPRALGAHLAQHGVTVLFLTTSLFNRLAHEAPAMFRGLRYLIFGGEAADAESARLVLEHGKPERLVNGYGPTETTTFAVCHRIESVGGPSVPIGRPIANTTAYLLDPAGEPVPVGVAGEIFIGGPGLALGYLNAPELTAARFRTTPFGRLYQTGDLAKWRADGVIEYLGRADGQIKLRGFRIEPGDVETALQQHPAVRQAVVGVVESETLAAWLVPGGGPQPNPNELREFLRLRLPAQMIPGAFRWIDGLPLTANGKLDRSALPSPEFSEVDSAAAEVRPRTGVEASISKIWKEILGRNGFSIRDDFFACGGHSLLAIQLLTRIRRQFGVEVPVRRLFDAPTIEGLGEFISANAAPPPSAEALQSLIPIQRGDDSRRPLFLIPGGWGGEVEFLVYAELVRHMDRSLPLYGLRARASNSDDLPAKSVEQFAAGFIDDILRFQPDGPYMLGGECVGGVIAYEMARQLEAMGREMALVFLLDTEWPSEEGVRLFDEWEEELFQQKVASTRRTLGQHLAGVRGSSLLGVLRYAWRHFRPGALERQLAGFVAERRRLTAWPRHLISHRLQPHAGRVTLLVDEINSRGAMLARWRQKHPGEIDVHIVPGDHNSYIREHAPEAAVTIRRIIDRACHFLSC